MDTTALQIFVEVVKRGSFAAVARDRHVDPSIVSRAIKGLEDELGSRLFQRTTRRLSLTEAGVAFFDSSRRRSRRSSEPVRASPKPAASRAGRSG